VTHGDTAVTEVDRDQAVKELEELAGAADDQKVARGTNFRRYSRLGNVYWVFASVLAGTAGLLALGDASKTLTAAAAFAAAFSAALEANVAGESGKRTRAPAPS
jgi:hypothetical protein